MSQGIQISTPVRSGYIQALHAIHPLDCHVLDHRFSKYELDRMRI